MNDEDFMRLALEEAQAAMFHDDVPVGAVAVSGTQIVATGHNEREVSGDPTAHAEVLVLRRAAERMGSWHLDGLSLYVTLEPCPMCAGALVAARVKRVIYGAPDLRAGAVYSLYNIVQDPRLTHRCEVTFGVLGDECSAALQAFFQSKRQPPQFL
jgi:tRNA(adenine34) deaminase